MRLDRLIPEFKDAVDKGTLAMVAVVDLSYLNVKMQKMIHQVAEAEKKIEAKADRGTAKIWKGDYQGGCGECTDRQGAEETTEWVSEAASGTV